MVYEKGINFVYVRDRKSFNGTYVNNMLVGKGPGLCSGFLLQDGDTIEILPYWKFILHQENSPPKIELSDIQLAESRVRVSQLTKRPELPSTDISLALLRQVFDFETLHRTRGRRKCVPGGGSCHTKADCL